MERNLRLLNWWWWSRWFWLGEGIWVVFLLEERGVTLGQVLLFEGVWAGTVLLMEVPSGVAADRFGRRPVLLLAGVVGAAAMFTFGLGGGLIVLLAAYAGLGITDASFSGAESALLYDTLEPLERTDEFEPRLGRLNALIMAGFAGMTVTGSLMVRWTPLATPILLSGALTLPSLLLMWKMTEPPRRLDRSSLRAIGGAALGRVLRTRSMWAVVLLNTVATLAIIFMAILQQPVLLNLGFPAWSLGIFIAGQMLVGAAASWLAGAVGARAGLRWLFLVVPLASSLALLAGIPDVAWLYALFLFPAAGFHLMFPHTSGFLSRRVTERERATVVSISSMVASATSMVVTPSLGLVVDRASLDTALLCASLGLTALTLLAYLAWATAGDVRRDPPTAPVSDDVLDIGFERAPLGAGRAGDTPEAPPPTLAGADADA